MERSEFSSSMPGELVDIDGPPDARVAFVPAQLPPAWQWPVGLYKLLIEARTSLASLDGTGRHLPDPTILIQPLQAREAQLSSKLEGTITEPAQQLLFQADPTRRSSPDDAAFGEVWNYRRALRLRIEGHLDLPLSLRLIRELHSVLMSGVRGRDPNPGEFRKIKNQIDQPARFVPPPPERLPRVLNDFEGFLHRGRDDFDPLVRAFLAHYQFEAIHPFRDGNGRVGRLLLALTIQEWCGLSSPWLYMSPYFERHRTQYLELLFNVSARGGWEEWVRFCLQGVVQQSHDAQQRCDRMLALHRDFHNRLAGFKRGSLRLSKLVDSLFESPVLLVTKHVKEGRVSYPTARADLERLVSLGIVSELRVSDRKAYYCSAIYNITYEEIDT